MLSSNLEVSSVSLFGQNRFDNKFSLQMIRLDSLKDSFHKQKQNYRLRSKKSFEILSDKFDFKKKTSLDENTDISLK